MDRRSFLRAVVAVPMLAAVSPLVAHREQFMHYRGARFFIDPECHANRFYALSGAAFTVTYPFWAERRLHERG